MVKHNEFSDFFFNFSKLIPHTIRFTTKLMTDRKSAFYINSKPYVKTDRNCKTTMKKSGEKVSFADFDELDELTVCRRLAKQIVENVSNLHAINLLPEICLMISISRCSKRRPKKFRNKFNLKSNLQNSQANVQHHFN